MAHTPDASNIADELTLQPQQNRQRDPDQESIIRAYEKQVWRHFQKWRFEDARELLERLLILAPEHTWGHYIFGEIAMAEQHPREALEHYRRAMMFGRRDAETLLRASEAAMKLRKVKESAKWMAAALNTPGIHPARRAQIEAFLQKIMVKNPATP